MENERKMPDPKERETFPFLFGFKREKYRQSFTKSGGWKGTANAVKSAGLSYSSKDK